MTIIGPLAIAAEAGNAPFCKGGKNCPFLNFRQENTERLLGGSKCPCAGARSSPACEFLKDREHIEYQVKYSYYRSAVCLSSNVGGTYKCGETTFKSNIE